MTQRVQIITGVERRRRFTDTEKRAIVAETEALGASVSAVARRHEIAANLLFSWRKAQRRGCLAVASLGLDGELGQRVDGLRLAVIEVRRQRQGKVARFPPEIRSEALALIGAGLTAAELVMATGLPPTTVSHWQQDYAVGPSVRELKLRPEAPASTPVTPEMATVRLGPSLSIELPVTSLMSDELLLHLLKIGNAS